MFVRLLAYAVLATLCLANLSVAGALQAEWVVLPADAKIYMHPESSAVIAEAKDGGGRYVTLRKVRELPSGWAEVETVCDTKSESASLCNYHRRGVEIRFFVHSETFLPVLRKQMKLRLANGRSEVFLPGTPVEPGSEPGLLVVRALDGSAAAVPANAVGRVYQAVQYSEPPSRPGSTMPSIFGYNSALGNHLPAKTRLYWIDGSVAGQLVQDHIPDLELEQRPCFHHRIGRSEALLCGDKKALDSVGAAMKEAFQKPQGEPP